MTAKYNECQQALEHFMMEVGQRFTTRTDERLLAVIYTLQQRTYKTGLPSNAPVPEAFNKELAGKFQLTRCSYACNSSIACVKAHFWYPLQASAKHVEQKMQSHQGA